MSSSQHHQGLWLRNVKDKTPYPTLDFERWLWTAGCRRVAGLDEAGRGAWGGPVVAAAVILPPGEPELVEYLVGVRDSKMLSAVRREALFPVVQEHALAWAVGVVTPQEIDGMGIVPATRQAMALALRALSPTPDYLLLDHMTLPGVPMPQHSLPKGDARVLSIAAASIIAKVSRDRMMIELDERYPGYGFAQHKGYGTTAHRVALVDLGPCALHRLSFAPFKDPSLNQARA
jgi:ribonuclease HII